MTAIKPIHPFPARMAPEIALREIAALPPRAVVLDPMLGSGTVVRVAVEQGHHAIGRDMDPLAVLMAKVWTTPLDSEALRASAVRLVAEAKQLQSSDTHLPWIDDDAETRAFVDYWFSQPQQDDVRRLAALLIARSEAVDDALRLALSRIIITKDVGASLARDASHSRPHRVAQQNAYSVMDGFLLSVERLARRLSSHVLRGIADVRQGDARCLDTIASETVDTVITSPPYLNAIDYLRGHRLSLVWFGYQLGQLRTVRAESIGTERAPDRTADLRRAREIISELELIERLPPRILRMIERYLHDLSLMIAEIHRVLRPSGRAILVIGNSSIRGVFVENARALVRIAEQAGLRLVNVVERELPPARRYLPPPVSSQHAALLKRMRTETVLSYVRDQPVLSDVRRCDASR